MRFSDLAPGICVLTGLAVYLAVRIFALWREGAHEKVAWDLAYGIALLFWLPSIFIPSWYMYATSVFATGVMTLCVVEMHFFQKQKNSQGMREPTVLPATRRAWRTSAPLMTRLQRRLHKKTPVRAGGKSRTHRKVVPLDEYRRGFLRRTLEETVSVQPADTGKDNDPLPPTAA